MELKDAIKGIVVTVVERKRDRDGNEIRKVIERPATEKDVLTFNEKLGVVVTVDGKKHFVKKAEVISNRQKTEDKK